MDDPARPSTTLRELFLMSCRYPEYNLKTANDFSSQIGREQPLAYMPTHLELPRSAVTLWKGRVLPQPGWPAGYAALIDHFEPAVPPPPRLTMIAEKHEPDADSVWQVLSRRLRPGDTVEAHLEFALKYEGISLSVLNALFSVVDSELVAAFVQATPTGKYARRVWFVYEWLTGSALPIPDLEGRPRYVDVVDTDQQVALGDGEPSIRQRVRNNLPGTPAFCPMVRWTASLRSAETADFGTEARRIVAPVHPDVIGRAAAFLLLKDSRSSFEIEGESPSRDRTTRWGRAIGEAGGRMLSVDEFIRLQRIVVGDDRFVELGLRKEGGFVGSRDRITRDPLPDHVSARAEDVEDLLRGIIAYEKRSMDSDVDPVVAAAAVAFGFVYVHPFVDGNGRVHRWLIHHVLAKAGFNPPGVPFPISAAILRHIVAYREVLKSYSRRLLDYVEWVVTERRNVRVSNDTADYYRYFDATAHVEFLYRCVEETVTKDLPEEIAYLESYDRFAKKVQAIVDMPDDTVDLLHRFLDQNDGTLSIRARSKEFAALTPDEVEALESAFREAHAA